ncbi:acyltransferase family protein [Paludibacterium paludis]
MVLFSHLGPCFLLADLDLTIYPVFSDGALAVYLFFVLSGLVMSIHHFRAPSRERLITAALRRYPRLCLPVLAASLIAVMLVQWDAMWNLPLAKEGGYRWLGQFYAFTPDAKDWLRFSLLDVFFRYDRETTLIPVLWTMQHELVGSMAIFAFLAVAGQSRLRYPLYLAAFAWLVKTESPLVAFLMGMMLADLIASPAGRRLAALRGARAVCIAMLILSLAAAMFRARYATPLHLSVLATGILAAISFNPALQRPFATPLSQQLGAMSFSLYLVHFLVLCSAVSALHLWLLRSGVGQLPAGLLTFATGTVTSLAAARLFQPLEVASMRLARQIGDAVKSVAGLLGGPVLRRAP